MSKNISHSTNEEKLATLTGLVGRKKTSISLTNERIYQTVKVSGGEELRMIPLHRIDSYGIVTQHSMLLLIIGILTIPLFGFGLIVLLIWWLTRKTAFVVNSVSGKMEISAGCSTSNRKNAVAFIHEVHNVLQSAG